MFVIKLRPCRSPWPNHVYKSSSYTRRSRPSRPNPRAVVPLQRVSTSEQGQRRIIQYSQRPWSFPSEPYVVVETGVYRSCEGVDETQALSSSPEGGGWLCRPIFGCSVVI
jgi:hypothetical protein